MISGDAQWAAAFGFQAGVHPAGWWLVGLVALATVSYGVLRLLVPDNDAALFAFAPLLVAVLLARLVSWAPLAYLAFPAVVLAEFVLVGIFFFGRRGD
jgi:hypothetical protein